VVDTRILHGLIGEDTEVVRSVLLDFHASANRIADAIRSACEADDAREAGMQAHKLKSAARTIGALGLGAICERIESIGRGESGETLADAWVAFEAEMQATNAFLEAWPGEQSKEH
jgi:HPt (histidine-containing phosphotransfer) domain-containing protein